MEIEMLTLKQANALKDLKALAALVSYTCTALVDAFGGVEVEGTPPPTAAPDPDEGWLSGPPPHTGWWNASRCNAEKAWRWWDGKCWSEPALDYLHAETAAYLAAAPDMGSHRRLIKWRHYYYPVNARVPRVAP